MALYECVFIARQDISSSQVEELAKKFSDILDAENGKILKTEFCGLRQLAYRIRKNKKGHYVMFHIEASGDAIAEMERTMRIEENVLRYLTVKVDAFAQGPSALSTQKPGREYRGKFDNSSGRGMASKSREDTLSAQEEKLVEDETVGEEA